MPLLHLFSKESLTRTTLIKMGIRIAIVIFAVTLLSYWHVMSNLELQVLEQLEKYIVERGQRESHLFQLIEESQKVFKQEFISRYSEMDKQRPLTKFNQLFEKREDGSTRLYSKYFYGVKQSGGFITKGLSGFIAKNTQITANLRRPLVIGYEMLSMYGPAWNHISPNLYLITHEDASTIILYWPGNTWGLETPANMDLNQEFEVFRIAEIAHNPHRETVWSGLYYDPVAKEWMVSSITPLDIKDQHLASVGMDVLLTDLFKRTLNDHLEGAYNLIFREDARLIVHSQKMDEIQKKEGLFNILQSNDQHLIRIFERVKNRGLQKVVIDNNNDDEYLAVTKIEGPDWYFVTVYPKSLLANLAFDTARFILILGLISLLIEITVLFFVLRQQVAKPLNKLMGATEQITKGSFETHLDITRPDEFGHLAHSFNAMSQEIQTREDSLRKANQLKDEFLANTSHELRTPLNGIIGIAESLREGVAGDLSDNLKVNLSMIVSSGKRLSALVNDILDFAKLKHKEIELQLKPVGLREIVDVILTLSQPLVAKKPVE
ncbi:MAG: histidine kinase dimerization/phospho-acceptor domain-containing protein, partial [Candidatus Parabeggiatoa sp.]|nr:histidine kinase dimerization/phospho-acceptor domain-containing protein [Candidatus Parabeggiatoa sp.]